MLACQALTMEHLTAHKPELDGILNKIVDEELKILASHKIKVKIMMNCFDTFQNSTELIETLKTQKPDHEKHCKTDFNQIIHSNNSDSRQVTLEEVNYMEKLEKVFSIYIYILNIVK